jgi:hypothetical protein
VSRETGTAPRGALELWPTLVEICYFRKHRQDLPQTRIRNQKRELSRSTK